MNRVGVEKHVGKTARGPAAACTEQGLWGRETWRLLQGLWEDLCVKTWAVLRTLPFIIRTM